MNFMDTNLIVRSEKIRSKQNFIPKLFEILQDREALQWVSWDAKGVEIIINDVVKFEINVLPHYFESGKLDTFARQLNLYGFKRTTDARKNKDSGHRMCSFAHPYFLRNRPELANQITRKKSSWQSKISGVKRAPRPKKEKRYKKEAVTPTIKAVECKSTTTQISLETYGNATHTLPTCSCKGYLPELPNALLYRPNFPTSYYDPLYLVNQYAPLDSFTAQNRLDLVIPNGLGLNLNFGPPRHMIDYTFPQLFRIVPSNYPQEGIFNHSL